MSLLIQVDVVHNHYVLMNDAPSQQQWQQPEYEEPDDQTCYVEEAVYQEQVEYYEEEAGQQQIKWRSGRTGLNSGEIEDMNRCR